MRILVDGLPREVGGVGTLIMNLVRYSRKMGNSTEFEFLVPEDSNYVKLLKQENYKFYIVPSYSDIIKYRNCVLKIFKRNKYEYLWFNNTCKVNIVLPYYAKKIGKAKIIAHTHGTDIEEQGIKRIIFKVIDTFNKNKMFSLIDVPFACSEESADIYYNGNERLLSNVQIIKNGIEIEEFAFSENKRSRIRKSMNIADDEIVLGAVGRITRVKNYPFLINVLKRLPQKYRLIIVGDGELKGELEKLIYINRLETRCNMMGSRDDVSSLLNAMDIFVLPSFNEGFPMSVVEAQANGLVCVVSSTVTKKIDLTGNVWFEDIKSEEEWENRIRSLQNMQIERYIGKDKVREKGYSIKDTCTNFYSVVI